ncbi:hypothetical protein ES702_06841 [subsurface metagenome]
MIKNKPKEKSKELKFTAAEEEKGRKKEQKKKEEKLPPFPAEETKDSIPGISKDEPEEIVLEEICRDIIAIPFEIWHLLRPGVEPLSEKEKDLISKPLSRVAQKYDVSRYMKDEFLLIAFLGFSVTRRLKIKKKIKKDDSDDNRKEREG